jgi:hypothetical protein
VEGTTQVKIIETKKFETDDDDTILAVFGTQGDAESLILFDLSDNTEIATIHLCMSWKGVRDRAARFLANALKTMTGGEFSERREELRVEFVSWQGHKEVLMGMTITHTFAAQKNEIIMVDVNQAFCSAIGEWIEQMLEAHT